MSISFSHASLAAVSLSLYASFAASSAASSSNFHTFAASEPPAGGGESIPPNPPRDPSLPLSDSSGRIADAGSPPSGLAAVIGRFNGASDPPRGASEPSLCLSSGLAPAGPAVTGRMPAAVPGLTMPAVVGRAPAAALAGRSRSAARRLSRFAFSVAYRFL